MKTLVYQYFQGTSAYHHKSAESIKAYAKMVGADYKMYSQGVPINKYYGTFSPFFLNEYDEYDAMFYVDSDILSTKNQLNVFEHCNENIGIHHMISCPYVKPDKKTSVQNFMIDMNAEQWKDIGHGNAGVVLFPRAQYEKFNTYLKDIHELHKIGWEKIGKFRKFGGNDQFVINHYNLKNDTNNLPWQFNYHLSQYEADKRIEAQFIHYHGGNKPLLHKDFEQDFILR